jgi:hypothetical protein
MALLLVVRGFIGVDSHHRPRFFQRLAQRFEPSSCVAAILEPLHNQAVG